MNFSSLIVIGTTAIGIGFASVWYLKYKRCSQLAPGRDTGCLKTSSKQMDSTVIETVGKPKGFSIESKNLKFSNIHMSKVEVQGRNKLYSFNVVDLTISQNALYNYLEATDQTTWNDLKRLFGGFKYAITNDCGRTLCRTYPKVYVNKNLLERDILFTPLSDGYILYDYHSNAQIVTPIRSKKVFQTQLEIKTRNVDTYLKKYEKVRQMLDGILVTIPDPFNVMDMMIGIEKLTPYLAVALRECFRMNGLMNEIRKSLKDLNLGLKGGMLKTPDMEALEECLFLDKVPPRWEERDYPSLLPLPAWYQYLLRRVRELESRVLKYQIEGRYLLTKNYTNTKTVVNRPTSNRKAMKNFPKDASKYHPVLLFNQLVPGIRYHTIVVSNPPPVVEVSTTIDGILFVERGSTKKAAMIELCVRALSYFYGYDYIR